ILQIDESKQQAAVAEAEADFRLAQDTLQRADMLLADGTISKQEHDQTHATYMRSQAALNMARKRLTEYTLTAPFDGTLGRRNVSVGQYVSSQTVLVSVYALDRMKLDFSVPERYSARVKPGLTLNIMWLPMARRSSPGKFIWWNPRSTRPPGRCRCARTFPTRTTA
ncbi:MAG: efflux RND transporter periplasmic adaptor subunit, partial [Verrucomicrobia bacterium]|nr:efflux RND transporter periplasmic adaptor subunit [Verrucomicrobiota bacterium]